MMQAGDWIDLIVPLVVMFGTLIGTGISTRKQLKKQDEINEKNLNEERMRHHNDQLKDAHNFEKQIQIQKEQELIAIMPFFTFGTDDVTVESDNDCIKMEFTMTNAGNNSAVHPNLKPLDNEAPGLSVALDKVKKISFSKEPAILDTTVRTGSATKFVIYAAVYDDNSQDVDMKEIPYLNFHFNILFYDLLENKYMQHIFVIYDNASGMISQRIIDAPERVISE